MEKSVKEFIGEKVVYDEMGQMIFAVDKDGGHQMFLDLRGWGHIQNMFKLPGGQIDEESAMKYQDKLGQWVVDAINEKLERE